MSLECVFQSTSAVFARPCRSLDIDGGEGSIDILRKQGVRLALDIKYVLEGSSKQCDQAQKRARWKSESMHIPSRRILNYKFNVEFATIMKRFFTGVSVARVRRYHVRFPLWS
jgi:hypothetical protein